MYANSLEFKHPLHVLFIDFAKAYDSVEHWIIEDILNHLNLKHFGAVVAGLLVNTAVYLKINNIISNTAIPVEHGTKQGDVISPTIFLLFIAPLLWAINKQCKGYSQNGFNLTTAAIVDDVAITSSFPAECNKAIKLLSDFSDVTGMLINPGKSAYAWNNCTKMPTPKFYGKSFKELSNNLTYKYLGIHIALNLCWDDQRMHSEKALRTTVDTITRKFYLNPTTLVNTVAFPSLGYRMQCIQFDRDWLKSMENVVTYALRRATKTSLSYHAWQHMYGLQCLEDLNYIRYATSLNRNLINNSFAKDNILNWLSQPITSPYLYYKSGLPHPKSVLSHLKLMSTYSNPNPPTWYFLPRSNYVIPVAPPSQNIEFFCDGSLITNPSTRMHWAAMANGQVWHGNANGPASSLEPELQPIENILHAHQNTHTIQVYSDSLNALININKLDLSSRVPSTAASNVTMRSI